MSRQLMKCGHTANGTNTKGVPICVVCFGRSPDAVTPAETIPDLTNRRAACACGREVDSTLNLAFFRHRPDREKDSFYCGCRGWN